MENPGASQRGPYAKTEQFRRQVLDTALRLVAERGFDATTLQLIADELGRSKAGLLHHFGSRDALMLAIVEERDAVSRRHFPTEPGFAASVRLVEHNAAAPGLVALFAIISAMGAVDTGPTERRRFFTERYARIRKGFTRQLDDGQAAGTVRSDLTAHELATLIVATMDGLQLQWLLDPRIDMASHLSTMIRLLDPARDPARKTG